MADFPGPPERQSLEYGSVQSVLSGRASIGTFKHVSEHVHDPVGLVADRGGQGWPLCRIFNRAIRGQRWYRQPIREDVYAIGENPSNKRKEWLAALDSVESVKPRAVVAGHKRHGEADNPKIIRETKQYIRDFDRLAAETHTAEELYKQMLALYPDRVNPGALWSSARAVKH